MTDTDTVHNTDTERHPDIERMAAMENRIVEQEHPDSAREKYTHVYVVNYTPHEVVLLRYDGSVWMRFESRGCARAAETITQLAPLCWDPFGDSGMTDALPRVAKTFGALTDLPEPRDDVMYIVSQIVADAGRQLGRSDLLVPSGVVRDRGVVVGCTSFS